MEGPKRAHVMKFTGSPGVWRSVCNKGPTYDAGAWYADHPQLGGDRSPLRETDSSGQPSKPWCVFCLRHVRELAESVGLI